MRAARENAGWGMFFLGCGYVSWELKPYAETLLYGLVAAPRTLWKLCSRCSYASLEPGVAAGPVPSGVTEGKAWAAELLSEFLVLRCDRAVSPDSVIFSFSWTT